MNKRVGIALKNMLTVAQLAERLTVNQEVVGSNPISHLNKKEII